MGVCLLHMQGLAAYRFTSCYLYISIHVVVDRVVIFFFVCCVWVFSFVWGVVAWFFGVGVGGGGGLLGGGGVGLLGVVVGLGVSFVWPLRWLCWVVWVFLVGCLVGCWLVGVVFFCCVFFLFFFFLGGFGCFFFGFFFCFVFGVGFCVFVWGCCFCCGWCCVCFFVGFVLVVFVFGCLVGWGVWGVFFGFVLELLCSSYAVYSCA